MKLRAGHLLVAALILGGCASPLAPSPNDDGDPPDIASIDISPGRHVMIVGDSVRLTAVAYTAECHFDYCSTVRVPAAFAWRSSDTTVVTVSGGLVRAAGPGSARVTAEAGGVSASASIEVGTTYVPLARVGAGGRCALTGAGVAYCWTNDFSSPNIPETVRGGLSFTSIATGSALTCAIAADAQGYCWQSGATPALIAGGLHFQSLSPGRRDVLTNDPEHTCGVLLDGTAVCWGSDDAGQLGTGSVVPTCHSAESNRDYRCSATPVPVDGLTGLVAVSAGGRHSCALAADGTAYCWGDNVWGQLGDSSTVSRETPRAVRGVPPLAAVVAGNDHTCGVTRTALIFCWGRNQLGQLGSGSQDAMPHPGPTLVAFSASIPSLDAASRTCALVQTGSVLCWGTPRTAVGGGILFNSIGVLAVPFVHESGARLVACGLATTGGVYCWDGAGSTFALLRPVLPQPSSAH